MAMNIRTTKVISDDELRASLKGGWDKELPAIQDENGDFIVGNRRMKIATELGIEPVIKLVTFGKDAEATAARIRLANVSNIGGAPLTVEDRKAQAEVLYKGGLTMEAIAHMLGVHRTTIVRDLENVQAHEIKTAELKPKRAKTAANPKGSGRRQGSRGRKMSASGPKPKQRKFGEQAEKRIAELVLDEGKTYDEAGAAVGASNIVVRTSVAREEGRRQAEPTITPDMLSMSAQEKLDAAVRQHKRKLDSDFEQRVRDEIKRRVDELILPHFKKQIAEAKQLYDRRRNLMDKATFNAIRRGLHPDSRNSISDQVLSRAFDAFMALEKYLLDEAASPTEWPDVPSNLAEWDKRRAVKRRRPVGPTTVARQ